MFARAQVVPGDSQENGRGDEEEDAEMAEIEIPRPPPVEQPKPIPPEKTAEKPDGEPKKGEASELLPSNLLSFPITLLSSLASTDDGLVRRSVSQQRSGVSITIDDPIRSTRKPSPPRGKLSNLIHVTNLVGLEPKLMHGISPSRGRPAKLASVIHRRNHIIARLKIRSFTSLLFSNLRKHHLVFLFLIF